MGHRKRPECTFGKVTTNYHHHILSVYYSSPSRLKRIERSWGVFLNFVSPERSQGPRQEKKAPYQTPYTHPKKLKKK
jgi:hypothetical protein